jgi:hypothetical protein
MDKIEPQAFNQNGFDSNRGTLFLIGSQGLASSPKLFRTAEEMRLNG